MSTGVVAASAAAVAMYWYLFKQKGLQDGAMDPVLPVEACRNAPDNAPSNWGEALYHVKEVLRYMYNETLGRWHTIDLFVGLAYLSHREAVEYPAADIAAKGTRLGLGCGVNEQIKLMLELQEARRYMLYCKGLKLRREEMQARFWKEHLGADTLTIVKQQPTAGVLRPAYVVVSDHELRCVVLCIRGTHSMKDLFTSLAGAAKPHHVVDPQSGKLVLGYSHLGMLAAARWLSRQVTPVLRTALAASPGYQLRIVGHSMGGGTAALLTMMFRGGLPGALSTAGGVGGSQAGAPATAATADASPAENITESESAAAAAATASASSFGDDGGFDPFLSARCVAIACPSVVTLELAAACREYVTSIVNGTDIVPTFCAASVDRLREDVTRSSWFSEFSRDMRSGVLRALQGGVRGVGTATQWTSRNILQPAVVPFRACYATTASRKARRRAAAAAAAAAALPQLAPSEPVYDPSATIAAAAFSSPNLSVLSAAEQHEQLLLAAGAGGGAAAAAAAAAAVAVLEGGGSPGLLPHSASAAAARGSWGEGEASGSGAALPPGLQSMSPVPRHRAGVAGSGVGEAGGGVDQRAMAEAVQSCMYAVNSAVAAQQHHHHHHHHHHHQQQQPQSPQEPTIAEALGLLESLPQELGPGRSGAGAGAGAAAGTSPQPYVPHLRGLEALDAADPWLQRRQAAAGGGGGGAAGPSSSCRTPESLLAGAAGAPLGASGGVSTAMVYGSSLRRRLWPWGAQGQTHDGAGGGGFTEGSPGGGGGLTAGSGAGGGGCLPIAGGGAVGGGGSGGFGPGCATASGSYSSLSEHDGGAGGGPGGAMTPPHMTAPDSPGKAKAAAAASGGGVGGGVGSSVAASTRAIGDWLWRGGGLLFTTCATPRRAVSAGPAGLGPGGVGGGGGGGGAAGARGQGPLLMDVGEGFDDESDPEEEDDDEEGSRSGSSTADSREEEEGDDGSDGSDGEDGSGDEDEDGAAAGGGGGVGARRGDAGGGAGGAQSSPGGLLSGGDRTADSEQQLQAGITAVVAAVTNQASREAAEGPSAILHDETTLAAEDVLREVREADAAAAAAGASDDAAAAATAAAAAAGSGRVRRRRGGEVQPNRESRRSTARRRTVGVEGSGGGAAAAAGAGGANSGRGTGKEDEPSLSPGCSSLEADAGSRVQQRLGISASEYEARLYKRRLYPAGRILHLFPGVVLKGDPSESDAGAGGAAAAAAAADAAAACTNPLDAAAARASSAQSPHVLFEVVDPQAYSRVRLCRTMVTDHLIPAYLAALDSVLGQIMEQQQRAAMDAWEQELASERREAEERDEQQQQQQQQQQQEQQ